MQMMFNCIPLANHLMHLLVYLLQGPLWQKVQKWMSSNRLRLNPTKTQYVWLCTCEAWSNIDESTMKFQFPDLNPHLSFCNLVVLLDRDLTMAAKVNFLCRSCFYQLPQIRIIPHNLSVSAAVNLMHSFVLTCMDYCHSFLDGLPGFRVHQLQSVPDCAACL